ncbi:hypothetical protein C4D60_Mb05t24380 [Musa balbisiana]|uniref:Cornichon family protein n=1 Tax=Musa balbisiana TaxID=52838 RepID=A0A4S8JYI5_MUSBA|nr:hypothetical protein C4D60_Mb05t24380 [Musa balbisiana]
MAWELFLWLLAFAAAIALIGFSAYQLICLSDLEFDYINPYDLSSRINAVVVPEFMVQGTLCILFLLTWHWFPFLLMAPITYYHTKLYTSSLSYGYMACHNCCSFTYGRRLSDCGVWDLLVSFRSGNLISVVELKDSLSKFQATLLKKDASVTIEAVVCLLLFCKENRRIPREH